MKVREGDRVETGTPLVTLDSDLQHADLGVARGGATATPARPSTARRHC